MLSSQYSSLLVTKDLETTNALFSCVLVELSNNLLRRVAEVQTQPPSCAARRPPTTLSFLGASCLFAFWFFFEFPAPLFTLRTLQLRDCYPVIAVCFRLHLSSFIFHLVLNNCSVLYTLQRESSPSRVHHIIPTHSFPYSDVLSHRGTLLAVLRHPAHTAFPTPRLTFVIDYYIGRIAVQTILS